MSEDNIIEFRKGKSIEDVVNSISLDAPEDPENHHRILEVLDKIQEKASQLVYGSLIAGLAVVGLVFTAKEKVLDKIKKF